jgi:hypothetical protein
MSVVVNSCTVRSFLKNFMAFHVVSKELSTWGLAVWGQILASGQNY